MQMASFERMTPVPAFYDLSRISVAAPPLLQPFPRIAAERPITVEIADLFFPRRIQKNGRGVHPPPFFAEVYLLLRQSFTERFDPVFQCACP